MVTIQSPAFTAIFFFYDNFRNSRALIGLFILASMNLKFVRRVSERERKIQQYVIVKKQIEVSF